MIATADRLVMRLLNALFQRRKAPWRFDEPLPWIERYRQKHRQREQHRNPSTVSPTATPR